MGIEVSYRRVSPERFEELQRDRGAADEFFYGDEAFAEMVSVYTDAVETSATHLSIEKEWQGLHYLLTGEVACDDESQVEPPACNVVMGGTPTPREATYGYARSLTPIEVKEVARFLAETPLDDLKSRFDQAALDGDDLKIYGWEGGWTEETWNTFVPTYRHLVKFYQEAAAEGQYVLISSD